MKKCMKYAPKVSLGHVANLVFATGGGRLDDAHGGAHGERGTDYSSLFVRVSGARAGTTTWMTSIVSDFHILFDESRTVDFECKGRAYPISSKSSIRRFVRPFDWVGRDWVRKKRRRWREKGDECVCRVVCWRVWRTASALGFD